MAEVRARLEPAHLAFLERHGDEIPMAGRLRNELGEPCVGGPWVCFRPLVSGEALPQYDVTM